MKYAHTNIIAKDWKKLSLFYQKVFECVPLPPERDLSGEWLERLTGIEGVHIVGEHLKLPNYEGDSPTLEIFSYNEANTDNPKSLNGAGLSHLAFEVDDVAETLNKVVANGGSPIGEIVSKEYSGIGIATFVYCRDIEGNIIELQSWEKRSHA
jgi:predicted enzyme related to lactoylglutathione lyase